MYGFTYTMWGWTPCVCVHAHVCPQVGLEIVCVHRHLVLVPEVVCACVHM